MKKITLYREDFKNIKDTKISYFESILQATGIDRKKFSEITEIELSVTGFSAENDDNKIIHLSNII